MWLILLILIPILIFIFLVSSKQGPRTVIEDCSGNFFIGTRLVEMDCTDGCDNGLVVHYGKRHVSEFCIVPQTSRWEMVKQSPCNGRCGRGTRNVTYKCIGPSGGECKPGERKMIQEDCILGPCAVPYVEEGLTCDEWRKRFDPTTEDMSNEGAAVKQSRPVFCNGPCPFDACVAEGFLRYWRSDIGNWYKINKRVTGEPLLLMGEFCALNNCTVYPSTGKPDLRYHRYGDPLPDTPAPYLFNNVLVRRRGRLPSGNTQSIETSFGMIYINDLDEDDYTFVSRVLEIPNDFIMLDIPSSDYIYTQLQCSYRWSSSTEMDEEICRSIH